MVTNNQSVICPCCKSINNYDIVSTNIIDNDLHITYICTECGTRYTDYYALVYFGGSTNSQIYDRDNLAL